MKKPSRKKIGEARSAPSGKTDEKKETKRDFQLKKNKETDEKPRKTQKTDAYATPRPIFRTAGQIPCTALVCVRVCVCVRASACAPSPLQMAGARDPYVYVFATPPLTPRTHTFIHSFIRFVTDPTARHHAHTHTCTHTHSPPTQTHLWVCPCLLKAQTPLFLLRRCLQGSASIQECETAICILPPESPPGKLQPVHSTTSALHTQRTRTRTRPPMHTHTRTHTRQ
jgi:hypothetical protein